MLMRQCLVDCQQQQPVIPRLADIAENTSFVDRPDCLLDIFISG
jgi:hypothetical protein